MQYKEFVRDMFAKHKGKMAAKDIMKLASQEWPAVRDGKMTKTTKSTKSKKSEKAGSLLGEILGYGLDDKKSNKKSNKMAVGGGPVGGSLLGEILGFGLDNKKTTKNKKMTDKQAMLPPTEIGGKISKKTKAKEQAIPKKTNPLSTFYQFDNLPKSNYAATMGSGITAGALNSETGSGFFDNILPLLSVAML